MYIPFASLLSLQAALGTFGFKQTAQKPESITPVPGFKIPENGGGSFIDKASDGLGEPLNVSPLFCLDCAPLPFTTRSEYQTKQVIISGLSSPWVLADGGFVLYANAIGL